MLYKVKENWWIMPTYASKLILSPQYSILTCSNIMTSFACFGEILPLTTPNFNSSPNCEKPFLWFGIHIYHAPLISLPYYHHLTGCIVLIFTFGWLSWAAVLGMSEVFLPKISEIVWRNTEAAKFDRCVEIDNLVQYFVDEENRNICSIQTIREIKLNRQAVLCCGLVALFQYLIEA